MELLDDVCRMESRFGLFRKSVRFSARYEQGLRLMHHSLRNHLEAPVGTSVKRLKWELGLICLDIVLILMQDRCRFAWNVTHAQKSIWTHPMELLDDVWHMKSCFGLFGDSSSFGAKYVHGLCLIHHKLRNLLDAPDGTPRWRGSSESSVWSVWR